MQDQEEQGERDVAFNRKPSLMVLAAREYCSFHGFPELGDLIGTGPTGTPVIPGGIANPVRPLDDALFLLEALRYGHQQPGGQPDLLGSPEEIEEIYLKNQSKNEK